MPIFHLLATFGGEMGVATMRTPNGLEPPNSTKMLAYWVGLWANCALSRKHVFEISRSELQITRDFEFKY